MRSATSSSPTQLREPCARALGRVVPLGDSAAPRTISDERPERDAPAVRQAPTAQDREAEPSTAARNSSTSADLPTPASPTIVRAADATRSRS